MPAPFPDTVVVDLTLCRLLRLPIELLLIADRLDTEADDPENKADDVARAAKCWTTAAELGSGHVGRVEEDDGQRDGEDPDELCVLSLAELRIVG